MKHVIATEEKAMNKYNRRSLPKKRCDWQSGGENRRNGEEISRRLTAIVESEEAEKSSRSCAAVVTGGGNDNREKLAAWRHKAERNNGNQRMKYQCESAKHLYQISWRHRSRLLMKENVLSKAAGAKTAQ